MYKTITSNNFVDAFQHAGRDKQFSYEGKIALYNWLEDNIENYELDVIAICCDYSEYETKKELLDDYSSFETIEEIEEQTEIIEFKKWDIKTLSNNDYSSYIIRAF